MLTGERVVLETGRDCMLAPEHILASSALLPLFAPVKIDGTLLGDDGLASNTPVDFVLTEPAAGRLRCYVVELFGAEGRRPHTLAACASRSGDLVFGNQTARLLQAQTREDYLRSLIAGLGAVLTAEQRARPDVAAILQEGRSEPADIVRITYRADPDEAGLGKPFDFSRATIADRWRAGQDGMRTVLLKRMAAERPAHR